MAVTFATETDPLLNGHGASRMTEAAVTDSSAGTEGGLDLRSLLADVLDHWPLLLAVSVLASTIGLYRAWVATPLFRAEALVQIEMMSSGSTLSDTMNPYPYARFGESVETQLEIVRSRSVLGEAVKAQHLDTDS